jgi:hypothetical protein
MIFTHVDFTLPENGELFVFGSNLAGIHGAGSAKLAASRFQAKYGVGFGKTGCAFAIPTKDANIRTLPIKDIRKFVDEFAEYTKSSKERFFITRVGCGLAGYNDKQIAPLFRNCKYDRCNFPIEWANHL